MPPQVTKKEVIEAIEDEQTILREEVELKDVEGNEEIKPPMTEMVNYSPEQINTLKKDVFDIFDAFVQDRKVIDGEDEQLGAQYNGQVVEEALMEFNLNVDVTAVKCDAVERLAAKAFIESDPKFTITLRPEAMRKGMDKDSIRNIERDQEDYLDYALDERINVASPLRKVLHQAVVLKKCGIMKVPYKYTRKRFIREEFYSGKKEDTGQVNPQTKEPILRAKGMEGFLRNYPTAIVEGETGHSYYKQLLEFKDARFEAFYWRTVHDDPKPMYVDSKNFYTRLSTEGYDGLCDEQCYIERTKYTYWQMKKKEEAGEMINVDLLEFATDKLAQGAKDAKYKLKEHNILEVTYHFKEGESKEETKIICLFSEQNKTFMGAFEYPYYNVECIYVPFYIYDKIAGFYKGGMAQKLTSSHQAQNSILNMMLTETWLELVSTPIVKEGSTIANQLLNTTFRPGTPLTIKATEHFKDELDFVPKPQKQVAAQLLNVLLYLSKLDGDKTGVSDIAATGKGDPLDPRAPAAKTAMLLKQSGINIGDLIDVLAPSFNKVGEIILKLTHQMSNSGRKFRGKQRAGRVTGSEVFSEISRDDMILETVIQSRASAFAFDKLNEKRENLALAQWAAQDEVIRRNPKGMHEIALTLLESWSPTWKAKADKIALSNEEFSAEVANVGIKALNVYMKGLMEQAGAQGGAPKANIKEFLQIVSTMMTQMVNPPEEEKK